MLLLALFISTSFAHILPISGYIPNSDELSDIACHTKKICAISSDEGNKLTFLRREKDNLKVLGSVALDTKYSNLDIESIAAYPDGYYAIGSHSVTKPTSINEGYFGVYKVQYNADLAKVVITKGSLTSLYEKNRYLKDHFKKSIYDNGVNIEALAYKDGVLVVGHRTPNVDGETYVLRINVDSIFTDRIYSQTQILHLGRDDYGIKEFSSIEQGFLVVLSRIDNSKGGLSLLYFWDGDFSRLNQTLNFLDSSKQIEGMEVLEQSRCYLKVILIEDENSNSTSMIENNNCL